MQRRRFLGTCVGVSGAVCFGALEGAWAGAAPQAYPKALLVDIHGAPLRARSLAAGTNYVFHYPYASTPCFLLNLGRPVVMPAALTTEKGDAYTWPGGTGPDRAIVAFSAICAHKLAYPTRDVSFIRYQPRKSATADAGTIHCCADHSVYDPAGGARVVSGPAPQPLAAVLLDYDPTRDELTATGTLGPEQFDAFFRKYELKLALEYGDGKAKRPAGDRVVVRELTQFCRTTIEC
jgi:arsenite oxidase small subunit